MKFTTASLIIREKQIGENDRLVVALTRDRGLVTAFASGAKRLKSPLSSSTALLAYSDITFYFGQDTYRINEASALEIFFDIRFDIERFSLAGYFCELALHLAPKEEPAEDFLHLILAALHFLQNNSRPLPVIKSAFELGIINLAGYLPDLRGCRRCGKSDPSPLYFDLNRSQLVCPVCLKAENSEKDFLRLRESDLYEISGGVLAAMRYISQSPASKLYSFLLPDGDLTVLGEITEKYVVMSTEREYQTLEFYKSLFY